MPAGYPDVATCPSSPGFTGAEPFALPLEVSALTHAGAAGTHARSPLLRLQSDERLIALIRRGNHHAFEALVARYQSRLLAFCRHMLSSREDAEDVLQEVFAAAFNAILADRREINVRPWLYRIARNRSLNHLRKAQAIGVDSMDVHLSEHGLTTADKVHKREEFRQLMADVGELPETQRTALLLREIDALSYEQIAEAMETTMPSVKSLLVRARVSLAEAAEARLLTCEEVREELGEVAEGLRRTTPPVRRHLRTCERCQLFRRQLRQTKRALAAIFPVGPLLLLKKALVAHAGHRGRGRRRRCRGAAAAAAAPPEPGAPPGLLQAGAGALASKAARRARRGGDRDRRRRRGQARQGRTRRKSARAAQTAKVRRGSPQPSPPRRSWSPPRRSPCPSPPPRRRAPGRSRPSARRPRQAGRRGGTPSPRRRRLPPPPRRPTPTVTPEPLRDHRAAAGTAVRAARGRHGHAAGRPAVVEPPAPTGSGAAAGGDAHRPTATPAATTAPAPTPALAARPSGSAPPGARRSAAPAG